LKIFQECEVINKFIGLDEASFSGAHVMCQSIVTCFGARI